MCFLSMMGGPSFRWVTLLFGTGEVCFFSMTRFLSFGEAVLLVTAVFCSLCYRVRDALLVCFKLNNQFQALVNSNTKVVLLPSIQSIPTALVDRYYTVIQTSNGCRGSLLSCQATWCCSCWVCAMEDQSQNRYSTHSSLVIYLRFLQSR